MTGHAFILFGHPLGEKRPMGDEFLVCDHLVHLHSDQLLLLFHDAFCFRYSSFIHFAVPFSPVFVSFKDEFLQMIDVMLIGARCIEETEEFTVHIGGRIVLLGCAILGKASVVWVDIGPTSGEGASE